LLLARKISSSSTINDMSEVEVSFAVAPPPGLETKLDLDTAPAPRTFPLTGDAPTESKPFEPYYTQLLASMEAAQAELNQSLTQWKDAIGDAEKFKENISKPGMGKAMVMVQGAREIDGRVVPTTFETKQEDQEEDEEEEESEEEDSTPDE
jgi:hypothetical protein